MAVITWASTGFAGTGFSADISAVFGLGAGGVAVVFGGGLLFIASGGADVLAWGPTGLSSAGFSAGLSVVVSLGVGRLSFFTTSDFGGAEDTVGVVGLGSVVFTGARLPSTS